MRSRAAVLVVSALVLIVANRVAGQPEVHTPYLDLVQQYRDGDQVAAIKGLAALPIDGLDDRVFHDLDVHLLQTLGGGARHEKELPAVGRAALRQVAEARAALLPAAALLHVETVRDLIDKDWRRAALHIKIARDIVNWNGWSLPAQVLTWRDIDGMRARIRGDVYVLIAAMLQAQYEPQALADHLDEARQLLPDDARIWLATGSAEARQASLEIVRQQRALIKTQIPATSWHRVMRQNGLKRAEEYFREALARDETLAEAHLRLGRVLYEREQWDEARASFQRAGELAKEPFLQYLAALFRAGLTAKKGDPGDARLQYVALTRRWPGCQSAHLGLSQLNMLANQRQAALGALLPLWQTDGAKACELDPWWLYDLGQAWQIDRMLSELREIIRRKEGSDAR